MLFTMPYACEILYEYESSNTVNSMPGRRAQLLPLLIRQRAVAGYHEKNRCNYAPVFSHMRWSLHMPDPRYFFLAHWEPFFFHLAQPIVKHPRLLAIFPLIAA
jgi:hypothetical protein